MIICLSARLMKQTTRLTFRRVGELKSPRKNPWRGAGEGGGSRYLHSFLMSYFTDLVRGLRSVSALLVYLIRQIHLLKYWK